MKTLDLDKLATSAPLNRTAAVVRDGMGEHWDGQVRDRRLHWDAPPPMRPVPPGGPSLVGRRVGRLTVVGFYECHTKGGKWVVRCTCGDYETRRAKAINNPKNTNDCCAKCPHLLTAQKVYVAATTGRWPDGEKAVIEPGLRTKAGNIRLREARA